MSQDSYHDDKYLIPSPVGCKVHRSLHVPVPGIDVDLRDGEEVLHDLEASLHGADVEHRDPIHPGLDVGATITIVIVIIVLGTSTIIIIIIIIIPIRVLMCVSSN